MSEDKSRNKSCWDRFGYKALISFTGYPERVKGIMSEFSRVGMSGVNVHYGFPTPFNRVLINALPHDGPVNSEATMSCAMNHYAVVKTAYCLGYESCLVMEDDIRFLNDVDEIRKTVEALPDDFDIALFDLIPIAINVDVKRLRRDERVNDRWFRYHNMRSMACYAFSRRMMERFIWLNEAAATDPAVGFLRPNDHFLDQVYHLPGMNIYGAMENIAVQRMIGDSINNKNNCYAGLYRQIGIDLSKYKEAQ